MRNTEREEVIAAGVLTHLDNRISSLDALAVKIKQRQKGYGQKMLLLLEHEARRADSRTMHVLPVEGAQAFYEKCGYDHDGRRYYKNLNSRSGEISFDIRGGYL